jgi:hypothetical protein
MQTIPRVHSPSSLFGSLLLGIQAGWRKVLQLQTVLGGTTPVFSLGHCHVSFVRQVITSIPSQGCLSRLEKNSVIIDLHFAPSIIPLTTGRRKRVPRYRLPEELYSIPTPSPTRLLTDTIKLNHKHALHNTIRPQAADSC